MTDMKDYDETRRLLYIGLAARHGAKRATLAGTIANALAHHRHSHKPGEALHFALGLLDGSKGADSAAWALIEHITADLDKAKTEDERAQ